MINFRLSRIASITFLAFAVVTAFAFESRASRALQTGLTELSSQEAARLLSHRDAARRREAAEVIARRALVEHLRLVEGYRIQEKDSRVRLALDWASYRLGKRAALFQVVNALNTSRYEQAQKYLKEMEGPQPLHIFLDHGEAPARVRLIEVLAHIGDAETLEKIKPLTKSPHLNISDAAKFAEREISLRLEETPRIEPKRPRQTGRQRDDGSPR